MRWSRFGITDEPPWPPQFPHRTKVYYSSIERRRGDAVPEESAPPVMVFENLDMRFAATTSGQAPGIQTVSSLLTAKMAPVVSHAPITADSSGDRVLRLRAPEPGPRPRTVHHPADPQGSRHRAGSAPGKDVALEDFPQGPLGRHRRSRLLQRRGVHAWGRRALPRALPHRPQDPPRPHRRRHLRGRWRLDGADCPQPLRCRLGLLTGFRHLIVDRDPLYTAQFRSILQQAGVNLLRLPANSPNLNAYAERRVRSIKHECLRHVIPLGERHLRNILRQFVEHYHSERNHQGLGDVIPFPAPVTTSGTGRVSRRERPGGLLAFYERMAA
jgi:hypothetical protein